jgi:hypothetical protein
MTATLTKVAHDDFVKLYDVEGYGVVSRGNAVFVQFCRDINSVDCLAVGQSTFARFHSGAGNTTMQVTRIS